MRSELVRLRSERRAQSIYQTDLSPLIAAAWYVHGTWVATGEEKTRGADEPKRPLFKGGFGALEFAVRVERVRFSSIGEGPPTTGPRAETILTHRDRALTFGVNWSPNRWIRVQANLVRDTMSVPNGEAPASPPLVDGPSSSFWSRVLRLRVAIRSRGLGSRNPTKPALRIDFDRRLAGTRNCGEIQSHSRRRIRRRTEGVYE